MKFPGKRSLDNVSRESERGSVLATSTIGTLATFCVTGLAIDINHFYSAKAELQNAAGATALADAPAVQLDFGSAPHQHRGLPNIITGRKRWLCSMRSAGSKSAGVLQHHS
jgi:Putative Flp pilus-assembly TadE/G-like